MVSIDQDQMRKDALDVFLAGVQAVEPAAAVQRFCQRDGNRLRIHDKVYDLTRFKDIYIVGAGKAGGPMARAMEDILGERITEGLVCVKYGHLAELSRVQLMEAAHPVPDDKGLAAAEAILGLASKAGKEDLVICLISGGGSALLPLPVEGVSLKDKQEITKTLLACGASIHEINAVRKHMSRVKGGGLARAVYPATLVSLMLSDVIGDDLDVIASGPTVPDPSSFQDCMGILEKYGIRDMIPEKVRAFFEKGIEGEVPETPKAGDPVFEKTESVIIGSNLACILAAEEKAEALGYNTVVLSTMIEGETREVAGVHVAIAREVKKTGHPVSPPACVLSGGETTVTITGQGLGGRNQEFVLAGAMALHGAEGIILLSAGTDGTDGPTDAAGAIADGQTMPRSYALGLNASDFLSENDSYHFFEKLGDLIKTGPTNTNVMDLRVLLIR
jgi:hydroxypyruvate reductase